MNSAFEALGLSEPLVRAVTDVGYATPTPIQQQAIPAILAGGDLMAGAQTGTGKTAAFVLPLLQRLGAEPRHPRNRGAPRVLILAPTRELAAQVEQSVRAYGKHSHARCTVIFGGVSIRPQIEALRRGVDIVVATPGRLLDHVGQRTIDLSKVEVLVLDEADRMLDMGFLPDMKRVFAQLPRERQTLLFSATFSDEIRALAASLLVRPATVQVTPRNSTVDAVEQKVIGVESSRKSALLAHLLREHQWFQVLVFTRTKHGANRLAGYLAKHDVTALAIHGNKSQNARTRALSEFKRGDLQVLVATDIAARGLDIEQLPHVVNFDLPNVPEDYVHRIGRTGRAGATGEAISLVSRDEEPLLRDIERLIRRPIARMTVAGFDHSVADTSSHDAHRRKPPVVHPRPAQPARRDSRSASGSSGAAARSADRHHRHARPKPPATARSAVASGAGGATGAENTGTSRSPGQPAGDSRHGRSDRSQIRTNIPAFLAPTARRGR